MNDAFLEGESGYASELLLFAWMDDSDEASPILQTIPKGLVRHSHQELKEVWEMFGPFSSKETLP